MLNNYLYKYTRIYNGSTTMIVLYLNVHLKMFISHSKFNKHNPLLFIDIYKLKLRQIPLLL